MWKCKVCHSSNSDSSVFCEHCGSKNPIPVSSQILQQSETFIASNPAHKETVSSSENSVVLNIRRLLYQGNETLPPKVTPWLKRASENVHDVEAQINLAQCYAFGVADAKQDWAEAFKWFKRAAEQGNASAQYNVGELYRAGHYAVKQDYVESAKWYTKAADQGFAEAQCKLGLCYMDGVGVKKDVNYGGILLSKAVSQGNEEAKKYLSGLKKNFLGKYVKR